MLSVRLILAGRWRDLTPAKYVSSRCENIPPERSPVYNRLWRCKRHLQSAFRSGEALGVGRCREPFLLRRLDVGLHLRQVLVTADGE
jgi:hypothetical protein